MEILEEKGLRLKIMLWQQFIKTGLLFFIFLLSITTIGSTADKPPVDDKTIVINSESMIADKPTNRIIFKGKVVATRGDVKINSDKMIVTYGQKGEDKEIEKIHAVGNVKVVQKDGTIYSDEAYYYKKEEKIEFIGNARADEGTNIIKGSKIIYYTKDDRVEVKDSEVFLKESKK